MSVVDWKFSSDHRLAWDDDRAEAVAVTRDPVRHVAAERPAHLCDSIRIDVGTRRTSSRAVKTSPHHHVAPDSPCTLDELLVVAGRGAGSGSRTA
jgi:hypothetical protein